MLLFKSRAQRVTLTRPVESARRYEYRVISITALTELRTQYDSHQGRLEDNRKLINEQGAEAWELGESGIHKLLSFKYLLKTNGNYNRWPQICEYLADQDVFFGSARKRRSDERPKNHRCNGTKTIK